MRGGLLGSIHLGVYKQIVDILDGQSGASALQKTFATSKSQN